MMFQSYLFNWLKTNRGSERKKIKIVKKFLKDQIGRWEDEKIKQHEKKDNFETFIIILDT